MKSSLRGEQRRRFDGQAGMPDHEIRADIFPGGAGDSDELRFGEAGPGVGEDERSEAEAGGEKKAGDETEQVRAGKVHGFTVF